MEARDLPLGVGLAELLLLEDGDVLADGGEDADDARHDGLDGSVHSITGI